MEENYGVNLRKDGIVEIRLPSDTYMEESDVRHHFTELKKLDNSGKAFLLMVPNQGSLPSKEAREYFTDNAGAITSCIAFVTDSLAQKLFVNFFVRILQSDINIKSFKTEEAAVVWLKNQMTSVKAY